MENITDSVWLELSVIYEVGCFLCERNKDNIRDHPERPKGEPEQEPGANHGSKASMQMQQRRRNLRHPGPVMKHNRIELRRVQCFLPPIKGRAMIIIPAWQPASSELTVITAFAGAAEPLRKSMSLAGRHLPGISLAW